MFSLHVLPSVCFMTAYSALFVKQVVQKKIAFFQPVKKKFVYTWFIINENEKLMIP